MDEEGEGSGGMDLRVCVCVRVSLTTANGGSWGPRVEQGEGDRVSIGVLGSKLNADGGVDLTADDGGLGHGGGAVAWQATVTPPSASRS